MIPRTSSDTLAAILDRGRSVIPREQDIAYVDLLRESLTGTERRICFDVITAVAPAVAEIGGMRAIEQCAAAIVDVRRWWP